MLPKIAACTWVGPSWPASAQPSSQAWPVRLIIHPVLIAKIEITKVETCLRTQEGRVCFITGTSLENLVGGILLATKLSVKKITQLFQGDQWRLFAIKHLKEGFTERKLDRVEPVL